MSFFLALALITTIPFYNVSVLSTGLSKELSPKHVTIMMSCTALETSAKFIVQSTYRINIYPTKWKASLSNNSNKSISTLPFGPLKQSRLRCMNTEYVCKPLQVMIKSVYKN